MSGYGVADVRTLLREREWRDWDELLEWLEQHHVNAQDGMSERDRDELLRDLRRLRDRGEALTNDVTELYQRLGEVRT
jgi:DNA-binding IclR family transcriptional regulator